MRVLSAQAGKEIRWFFECRKARPLPAQKRGPLWDSPFLRRHPRLCTLKRQGASFFQPGITVCWTMKKEFFTPWGFIGPGRQGNPLVFEFGIAAGNAQFAR
jgi:hypothetical protein